MLNKLTVPEIISAIQPYYNNNGNKIVVARVEYSLCSNEEWASKLPMNIYVGGVFHKNKITQNKRRPIDYGDVSIAKNVDFLIADSVEELIPEIQGTVNCGLRETILHENKIITTQTDRFDKSYLYIFATPEIAKHIGNQLYNLL